MLMRDTKERNTDTKNLIPNRNQNRTGNRTGNERKQNRKQNPETRNPNRNGNGTERKQNRKWSGLRTRTYQNIDRYDDESCLKWLCTGLADFDDRGARDFGMEMGVWLACLLWRCSIPLMYMGEKGWLTCCLARVYCDWLYHGAIKGNLKNYHPMLVLRVYSKKVFILMIVGLLMWLITVLDRVGRRGETLLLYFIYVMRAYLLLKIALHGLPVPKKGP